MNLITIPLYRYSRKTYLFVNSFLIWFIFAFRSYSVGNDTITYVGIFEQASSLIIPSNIINWFAPVNGARFENGYLLLNKALYSINSDPRFLIVVTSTIMICCLIYLLIELRVNYIAGVIIFETMGFMSFFMNALRQGLACSFCMVAMVFAYKKRPLLFLLFCYLAISMHVTSILFLLVYPLTKIKKGWKWNLLFLGLFIIVFTSFDILYSRVSSVSFEANTFMTSVQNNNFNGALNIIVSILVIIFILFIQKLLSVQDIDQYGKDHVLITFSYYLLIIAIGAYLMALHFSQLSRLSMYFLLGYFPLISYIFNNTKTSTRYKVTAIFLSLFMIARFIIVQIYRPEWSGIVPYSFL